MTYKEPLDIWHFVAPVRERGLKCNTAQAYALRNRVAPVRERGLKFVNEAEAERARKVAPVRERGLKCFGGTVSADVLRSRSRKGAWIEIDCCRICCTVPTSSLP